MKWWVLLLLLFPLLCTAQQKEDNWHPTPSYKPTPDMHNYRAEVFTNPDSTFGYYIFRDNKQFIKQASVPNRSDSAGFATKPLARKYAWMIIGRLRQGRTPELTDDEKRKLGL